MHAEGWKLYVSATVVNFVPMIKRIAPLLLDRRVCFKYLSTLACVDEINSGRRGYSQIGKCLVVYADGRPVAEIVDEVARALRQDEHCGPRVPRLARVWDDLPIFYRFGSYSGLTIGLGDAARDDDRDVPITEGWSEIEALGRYRAADDSPLQFLLRFRIHEVICKAGKGGVFRAYDRCDGGSRVIVKIGLRHGQTSLFGVDAGCRLEHEARMYGVVREQNLDLPIAESIDFCVTREASLLAVRELAGPTLAERIMRDEVDIGQLLSVLEVIRSVHLLGMRWYDAKAANVIMTDEGVKVVDLESLDFQVGGFYRNEQPPVTFRVEGLTVARPTFDLIHFLVSCIFRPEMASSGSTCREISLKRLDIASRGASGWRSWVTNAIHDIIQRDVL